MMNTRLTKSITDFYNLSTAACIAAINKKGLIGGIPDLESVTHVWITTERTSIWIILTQTQP
jgi:hypothetical protein